MNQLTKKDKRNIQRRKKYAENKNHNKAKQKIKHLRKRYGINIVTYDLLLKEQNNCCAICGIHQSELTKSLHVDHNHETGKVRGLLCTNCNSVIGFADDSIEILDKAKTYLNKYK